MKTLLLLFVGGILGYVHCQADHHPCDRLAVNIKTSATDDNSNRKGMDRHNQLIDLGDLLETPKVRDQCHYTNSSYSFDKLYFFNTYLSNLPYFSIRESFLSLERVIERTWEISTPTIAPASVSNRFY